MVIAIDGPGGVGKTTVTRRLATVLGLEFLDTGATYRAATVAVLRSGVDPLDGKAVLGVVRAGSIGYDDGIILLDGESVVEEVRSEAVTQNVSAVSAHAPVRTHLVNMQRDWVRDSGGRAVVEGRDIGTVVFPEAPVKIFLSAAPEVRAARRAGDAEAAEQGVAEIVADLQRRDRADSTREASPLRKADDAVEVDTSSMDIEEVVATILGVVSDRRSES